MIGDKIKEYRKQRGLTQKRLGELCEPKIAEPTIRKYELGLLNPKVETIAKIAAALEVTPFDLMGADYWDMTIGKEGLAKLGEDLKILDIVEKQHGKIASKAVGLLIELNSKGQEKALEYISDLYEQPKYTEEI